MLLTRGLLFNKGRYSRGKLNRPPIKPLPPKDPKGGKLDRNGLKNSALLLLKEGTLPAVSLVLWADVESASGDGAVPLLLLPLLADCRLCRRSMVSSIAESCSKTLADPRVHQQLDHAHTGGRTLAG